MPVTEQIRDAAATVDALYERHVAGGAMHIVTDDWNLDDAGVAFCGEASMDELEEQCFVAFRALREEQRATAMAVAEHFYPSDVSRDDVTVDVLERYREFRCDTPTGNHRLLLDRRAYLHCSCGGFVDDDWDEGAVVDRWEQHYSCYEVEAVPGSLEVSRDPQTRFTRLYDWHRRAEGLSPIVRLGPVVDD